MRLVLDTNVIISALLFDGSPEKLLLSVVGGPHQLVISPYIISETSRILETKFMVNSQNSKNLQSILSESEIVYFEPFLNIVADKPDNRIIETAVKGGVDYLVTGDKLLLSLGGYQDIKIVTTADLLKLL